MIQTYNVEMKVNQANWKRDFLVKQPVEGYVADFEGLNASDYMEIAYTVNRNYSFKVEGIDFVKTKAAYHDGESLGSLTDEAKALTNDRVKATLTKLLNSEYNKVGPSIYGNPEFTFISNRLDFYPGNVEKEAQYEALLNKYNTYKTELSEQNKQPDTKVVAEFILAVKALGKDEKAFGENNLIDDINNSSSDVAFADNYKIYALFAAGNDDYKALLSDVKAKALGMATEGRIYISKDEIESIMPILLDYGKDDEITAFVNEKLIPYLSGSVTGFGTFNATGVECDVDPLTDASALMVLGLTKNDYLSDKFIKNDNKVVDYFTDRFEDGVDVTGNDLIDISKSLLAVLNGNIYDFTGSQNPEENQNPIENPTQGDTIDDTDDVLGAEFNNDADKDGEAVLGESFTKTFDQTIVLVFVLAMIISSCISVVVVYFKKRVKG